jgi:hypothetical protein
MISYLITKCTVKFIISLNHTTSITIIKCFLKNVKIITFKGDFKKLDWKAVLSHRKPDTIYSNGIIPKL